MTNRRGFMKSILTTVVPWVLPAAALGQRASAAQWTVITTTAGDGGVSLPPHVTPREYIIRNSSPATLRVYGDDGYERLLAEIPPGSTARVSR